MFWGQGQEHWASQGLACTSYNSYQPSSSRTQTDPPPTPLVAQGKAPAPPAAVGSCHHLPAQSQMPSGCWESGGGVCGPWRRETEPLLLSLRAAAELVLVPTLSPGIEHVSQLSYREWTFGPNLRSPPLGLPPTLQASTVCSLRGGPLPRREACARRQGIPPANRAWGVRAVCVLGLRKPQATALATVPDHSMLPGHPRESQNPQKKPACTPRSRCVMRGP